MLFDKDSTEILKDYLIAKLEPICDGDPQVISKYVIQMLKGDKPSGELKAICSEKLAEFLNEDAGSTFSYRKPAAKHRYSAEEEDEEEEDDQDKSHKHRRYEEEAHRGHHHSHREDRRDAYRRREDEGRDRHAASRSWGAHFGEPSAARRKHYLEDREGRAPRSGFWASSRLSSSAPFSGAHSGYRQSQRMAREGNHAQRRSADEGRDESGPSEYASTLHRPFPASRRIIVEKIPEDCCTAEKIREHFGQFGTISQLHVERLFRKAILAFSKPEEAAAAYRSPEVIFNNRFVKVYWDQCEVADAASSPASAVDPALTERQRSLKNALAQRESLINKQIAEQKILIEKLGQADLSLETRQEIMQSLKTIQESITLLGSKPLARAGSPAQSKATAAAADSSGINGASSTEAPSMVLDATLQADPAPRLAYSNRGRFGARGYLGSAFSTRARGRGSYVWVRGASNEPARSMKMDLRSKTILLTPAPLQSDDEGLKKSFAAFGIIESMQYGTEDKSTLSITYRQRYEAENAIKLGAKLDLGQPFTLSWKEAAGSEQPLPSALAESFPSEAVDWDEEASGEEATVLDKSWKR